MEGVVVKVSGPLLKVSGMLGAKMFDVVHVGEDGLIGEIVEMHGDIASVQVYENTSGIGPGDFVVNSEEPLSVELAPGLIGGIFDGIGRPLDEIYSKYGDNISRGSNTEGNKEGNKEGSKAVNKVGSKAAVIAAALAGLVIGYVAGGLEPAMLGHTLPVLFVTGMVAFCAMILPGISGAYITLIFNQYEYLLDCIHTLNVVPLIVFSAGGILGILGFTRVLKYLLSRYHAAMLAMLTGLMIGTSRLLIGKIEASGGFTPAVILCAVVGVVLLVILEYARRNCISKEQSAE